MKCLSSLLKIIIKKKQPLLKRVERKESQSGSGPSLVQKKLVNPDICC